MAEQLRDARRQNRPGLPALSHAGVLSRRELRGLGWDRRAVAREVRAGRWALHGHETVAIHTGPLSAEARRWRAVWEIGFDIACIDGVTALQAAGLTGYEDDDVHVSVLHTMSVKPVDGVRVHKVIRRVEGEHVGSGLPRTRPAVAAIRAAHWARSDRQAALLLAMPVQQRLVTGRQLVTSSQEVRGRTRRRFIGVVCRDVADGAQSLGELDFAVLCRQHGLPEPSRQVVVRGPIGRLYLDVRWDEVDLVVEIDGSHHQLGLGATDDALRQNAVVLRGSAVLRMTLLGLRLVPEEFMAQVCEAYRLRSLACAG